MSTAPAVDTTPPTKHNSTTQQSYGGHSDRETPGPIPNPEAKPASADDTTQPGWKSRTPPNTHKKGHPTKVPFFTPTPTNREIRISVEFYFVRANAVTRLSAP